MERVETLCDRLKEQIAEKTSIDEMLVTVQMLQSELQHLKSQSTEDYKHTSVAIHIPTVFENSTTEQAEKQLLQLNIDEKDVVAELEQIRKTAETINSISVKNRKPFSFDPIEETPTLQQQKNNTFSPVAEVNTSIETESKNSVNDAHKETKKEVSDTFIDTPIKDLKKAIGINDRFLYINELFNGDEVMYDRSIKTINSFSIFPEAEYWIRRELKIKLGWDEQTQTVKQFDQLIKRRFASI